MSLSPSRWYVHTTGEFAFDAVIRDIARTYHVPTDRFAAETSYATVLAEPQESRRPRGTAAQKVRRARGQVPSAEGSVGCYAAWCPYRSDHCGEGGRHVR
ncbi:hypothetical protein ABZW11_27965 [Nonomuraea sp. NPDC004580]|uniref:hypothetical protein n=1 Tax=Nonomuraea sp. NPDC004580 TaxID=3154552 RepID=UPI0033A9AD72